MVEPAASNSRQGQQTGNIIALSRAFRTLRRAATWGFLNARSLLPISATLDSCSAPIRPPPPLPLGAAAIVRSAMLAGELLLRAWRLGVAGSGFPVVACRRFFPWERAGCAQRKAGAPTAGSRTQQGHARARAVCSTFLCARPGGESKHERKRAGCQDDPGHPAAAVAAAAAASRSPEQDLGHDAALHGPGRTGPPARAAELCRSTFCVRLFAHLKRQVEPRTHKPHPLKRVAPKKAHRRPSENA